MATQNPYTDQPDMEWYRIAWDQGYQYGAEHPAEDNPGPPSIFPPLDNLGEHLGYMQQVWSEGALAARQDHHPNIEHVEAHGNALGHAVEGIDQAHTGVDVARVAYKLVAGTVEVGEVASASILVFITLIGMTEPGEQEKAEDDLKNWFAQACHQYNCTDFYLAVDWPTPGETHGWHGPQVHDTFDAARDDAAAYLAQYPDSWVQVARYQAAAPGQLEMIPLVPDPAYSAP